jgi:hypothetical protein
MYITWRDNGRVQACYPGFCVWWGVNWKRLGSDCELVGVLARGVSGGTKESTGKFGISGEHS